MVEGQKFCQTGDFSRSDAWKLIPSVFKAIKTIWQEKPDAIITTGAAPGLVYLLVGRLLGRKTIWIDSIAKVTRGQVPVTQEKVSLWEFLMHGRMEYLV